MLDDRHTGCRLIHGESDALPGVIADLCGHRCPAAFVGRRRAMA
jgi:hypothetical protein